LSLSKRRLRRAAFLRNLRALGVYGRISFRGGGLVWTNYQCSILAVRRLVTGRFSG
jgi:hypothetical protein